MENLNGEILNLKMMKNDSDLIKSYLNQQQDLYGDSLYIAPKVLENSEVIVEEGGNDLTAFYHLIKNCLKCDLGNSRKNFVFGVGNPEADIVFVGEAPGKNEDLQGEPFVGRAGKLLNDILAAIELSRDDVFILNVLKCRPPQNREPLTSEIEECEPFLKKQLEIIKPKLIVALGRIAGNTLLRTEQTLGNLRNEIHKYDGIDLVVTYHPAALLRNPQLKRPTWEDFKMISNNYLN